MLPPLPNSELEQIVIAEYIEHTNEYPVVCNITIPGSVTWLRMNNGNCKWWLHYKIIQYISYYIVGLTAMDSQNNLFSFIANDATNHRNQTCMLMLLWLLIYILVKHYGPLYKHQKLLHLLVQHMAKHSQNHWTFLIIILHL